MAILHNIYFSAKGTTKVCADHIANNLHMTTSSSNWLTSPCDIPTELDTNDVLLFSMPVYGGFIPQICAEMADNLKGNNTPAIIAAIYGNRHYDNALLQMKDILTKRGFRVIAAGAFLAEHSIFPSVAAGRPDEADKAAMAEFAAACRTILSSNDIYAELNLPGNPDYDASAFKGSSFKPEGNDLCVECGVCITLCPMDAIKSDDWRKTDSERCISCGACIYSCPVGARNYYGEAYELAKAGFEKRCAEYRLPETFVTVHSVSVTSKNQDSHTKCT